MAGLFLSTYINKVDKKGRVSVPASFRNSLNSQIFQGIIAYPSFVNECVEACGYERIELISNKIDSLDPYSQERDAFATAILGASLQLSFDSEGRVVLPEMLLQTAGIVESAVFVGKGQTFEIWNEERFKVHASRAREIALQNRLTLSMKNGGGN